jgi:hypothetical protein
VTTTPAATELSCPYACGNVRAFDPARRFCNRCSGWLKFCRETACRAPNRIFARFCRRCRAGLEPWESWPCYGANPAGSGYWRRPAPWRDLHGVRLHASWKEEVSLGSPAPSACAVATAGTLLAFTAEGTLMMIDLRSGRAIDRSSLSEDPVSLYATSERVLATSSERLRLFSVLGRSADDYSASGPTGFRRVGEKAVRAPYLRFVGGAIPYGPHLVCAAAGHGAFGLMCLKLDSLENVWEDDPQKSFPGELAFLAPWGEAGLIVGNRDGQVVGLSGIKGSEAFRIVLPGALYETFPRAAVHGGALYAFNAHGDLTKTELTGRRQTQVVGEVHIEHPSSLGVSEREIVVGNRHGHVFRFNPFGLDRRTFGITARTDEGHSGFTLPPVLSEDGCLLAASDGGTLMFFGPRSDAAPLERTFAFPTASPLSAFLLEGSTLVGLSARGEVQAYRILAEDAKETA